MFKFCPRCGTELTSHVINNVPRLVCPNCHYVHWSDETISTGGIVIKDQRILLVQRAQHPGRGLWTNPGGFVEQTEDLGASIAREIKEETGLITKPREIVLVADKPGNKEHNIFVNFRLDYVSGDFHIQSDELLNAGFFTLEETKQMPVAKLTQEIIKLVTTDGSLSQNLTRVDVPSTETNGFTLYK